MHNVLVINCLGVQEKINMKISRKKIAKRFGSNKKSRTFALPFEK